MPTMFPKGYIIERIDARMASIARQGVQDAAAIAAAELRERDLVIDWLDSLANTARELAARAEQHSADLGTTTIAPADLTAKARGIVRDLPRAPDVSGFGRNVSDADGSLFSLAAEARNRLKSAAREGYGLEHARAYLVDTPVETFSKTDLRDLNLLGVVAFRLEAVRG